MRPVHWVLRLWLWPTLWRRALWRVLRPWALWLALQHWAQRVRWRALWRALQPWIPARAGHWALQGRVPPPPDRWTQRRAVQRALRSWVYAGTAQHRIRLHCDPPLLHLTGLRMWLNRLELRTRFYNWLKGLRLMALSPKGLQLRAKVYSWLKGLQLRTSSARKREVGWAAAGRNGGPQLRPPAPQ